MPGDKNYRRVLELAQEAGFVVHESDDPNSPPSWHGQAHNDTFEKFASLLARPSLAPQEPVAWRHRFCENGTWRDWQVSLGRPASHGVTKLFGNPFEQEPLYAALPSPQAAPSKFDDWYYEWLSQRQGPNGPSAINAARAAWTASALSKTTQPCVVERREPTPIGLFWQTVGEPGKWHYSPGSTDPWDIHDNGKPIHIALLGERVQRIPERNGE